MKRQNLRTVSLCVFTLTYLLIGAAIFGYLEFDSEVRQRESLDLIEQTIRRHYNISEEDYSVLWTTIIKSAPHKAGIQWKFPGAFYFAVTVVTTIGYGHSTPSTVPGRMFCMAYALVGVPLGLVMFQCIGERLNSFVSLVLRRLKRSMGAKNQDVTETNKVMVVSVLSTILMTSMAAVFARYEQWEYLDALYYCFITLTTIGFGDFVALQKNLALQRQPEYVVYTVVFILFGLSVVSSAVNLLVLKFLTLNTEDERRDELLKTSAAMNPIMIEGDVITSSAGGIQYVGGLRAAKLGARRRRGPSTRRMSAGAGHGSEVSDGETAELRLLNGPKKFPRKHGTGSMGSPTESGDKNISDCDRESYEHDELDERIDGMGSHSDLASQTSGGHLCDCRTIDRSQRPALSARMQQLKSPSSGQFQMPPSRCSPGTKSAFSSSNGSLASFACNAQLPAGAALYAAPAGASGSWSREPGCNCDADDEDDNQPECCSEHCQEHQKCQQTNQSGYQRAQQTAGIGHEPNRAGQRRPHLLQASGANQSSCSCSWVSLASDCASPPQEPTGRPLASAAAEATTTKSSESLRPRPFLRPRTRMKANAAGLSSSSLSSCLLLDPGDLARSDSQDRARGLLALQGRTSGAPLKHQAVARWAFRSPHALSESQDSPLAETTNVRRCRPDIKLMPGASGEPCRQSSKPTRSAGELAHARRQTTQLTMQIQQSDTNLMGQTAAVDQDEASAGRRQVGPDICSSLDYAELDQRRITQSSESHGSATGAARLVCRCCCQHAECIEFAIGAANKGRGNRTNHRTSSQTVAPVDETFPETSRTFQQTAPPSPTEAAHCDKGGEPERCSPSGRHSDPGSNSDVTQAAGLVAGGVPAEAPDSSCDGAGDKRQPAPAGDENHNDTHDWPSKIRN